MFPMCPPWHTYILTILQACDITRGDIKEVTQYKLHVIYVTDVLEQLQPIASQMPDSLPHITPVTCPMATTISEPLNHELSITLHGNTFCSKTSESMVSVNRMQLTAEARRHKAITPHQRGSTTA
jgi:hypothetical protein